MRESPERRENHSPGGRSHKTSTSPHTGGKRRLEFARRRGSQPGKKRGRFPILRFTKNQRKE